MIDTKMKEAAQEYLRDILGSWWQCTPDIWEWAEENGLDDAEAEALRDYNWQELLKHD